MSGFKSGLKSGLMSSFLDGSGNSFVWHQKGQSLLEYAMILILVGIAVIVALALLGPTVGNMYSNVVANI